MNGGRAVEITVGANHDLADIWNHISKASGDARAKIVIRRLITRCHRLRSMSFSGRPFPELGDGLRGLSDRPFLIFYRVKLDVVEVVHIFHAARDITPAMFDQ